MKVRCNSSFVIWILVSVVASIPSKAWSQLSPDGGCEIEGLVMAGVFDEGLGLNAGLTGQITYWTPNVRDWRFELECVEGRLRLTSGRVNGATEVTNAVSWVWEKRRTFLVAFRGDDLDPQGHSILFTVRAGLLPNDTPVVTYTSTDGNSVLLLKGILAFTAAEYETYVPSWR